MISLISVDFLRPFAFVYLCLCLCICAFAHLDNAGFDLTMELFSAFFAPRRPSLSVSFYHPSIQDLHSTLHEMEWNDMFLVNIQKCVHANNFKRKFTRIYNLCNVLLSGPPPGSEATGLEKLTTPSLARCFDQHLGHSCGHSRGHGHGIGPWPHWSHW